MCYFYTWLFVLVHTLFCVFPFRLSYLSGACSALQRFQFLPAAHSLQIISSCVITGSLAEFRTCLSVGLQHSLSLGCNIDVPFGRWFHPKLLTGPLRTFLARLVPVGVKPPHPGSVNVILHHEGHETSLCPPLTSSFLRPSSKSAVWEFGPSNQNNPAVSGRY